MSAPETAKVKYVGPFADGVYLPALDREVKPGEALEVPLDVAAALALQADWQAVGKSAAPIAEAQQSIPQAAVDPETNQIVVPPAPPVGVAPPAPTLAPAPVVAAVPEGGQ
jgi:hypothetical protein